MSATQSVKYVLVTGASRGIGRACALRFAEEGWHVFLNCRSSLEELEKVWQEIQEQLPGQCTLVPGDVGNPEEVRQIFKKIYQLCPCLGRAGEQCRHFPHRAPHRHDGPSRALRECWTPTCPLSSTAAAAPSRPW